MIQNYPPPTGFGLSAIDTRTRATVPFTRTFKLLGMLLLILVGTNTTLRSQTQGALLFDSATQQGVQEAFYKNNITKTSNNIIYTTGATLNASGQYDIIVTKHNNANVEQWTQVWSNSLYSGLDMASDLTIDANGDVIVVGTTQLSLTDYDAVILKYSSSGTLLWSQTFGGSANGPDGFLTVLANGTDIYCGGGVLNNVLQQHNALAVKYNTTGALQWSHQYNSSNNLRETHNRVALSGGNVVFYGGVQTLANPITWTMVRLELVGATGAQVSANLSSNVSSNFTAINDIDLDAQDNIYVAGYLDTPQGRDVKVVKLVSMAVSWTFSYNGVDNLDDEAHCIDVNGSSLYVAGYTTSAANGKDAYLVRIPTAGPPTTWQKIFDEEGGDDSFTALNIDPSGQLYLAGSTFRVSNLDLSVCKVNFQNGTVIAKNSYNNDYNGNDYANGVAIDEQGNVFVASQSEVATNSFKYNLVKFAQKTLYMPLVPYSSSGGYIANVSQLRNPDGTANQSVLYYNRDNRVATYLDDAKLSYQLVQGADTTNADTTYRVDMRFTKGSTTQKIYPYHPRKEYHNYYLAQMLHKGERTPVYNSLWKNNVYTNTDILYTNGPSEFKQYIIARAGAPTGDFEMTFDGQSSLSVDANGALQINTTIGAITYAKAKAYSMNGTTGALTLLSWQPNYVINANKVSFSGIGAWGGILVLELGEPSVAGSAMVLQQVDWSTMFGAQGVETFKGNVANSENDVFVVGNQNPGDFIENIGEYIGQHSGLLDAFLVKFNENCKAIFISYYGSAAGVDDFLEIDLLVSTNQLHVVGKTSSPDLELIDAVAMEDATLGGPRDGLYVKFSADGFLLFHTYVGGDGYDHLVDIKVSNAFANNNEPLICYVGNTESGEGWPIFENSAPNESMGYSGGKDGFYIRRMGVLEEQVHRTFFGSSVDDVFLSLDFYKGTPIILGRTMANDYSTIDGNLPEDGLFPRAHAGFWNSDFISNNGSANSNYFITHFGNPDPNNVQYIDVFKWCTFIAPCQPIFNILGHDPESLGDIVVSRHLDIPQASAEIYITGMTPIPLNTQDLEFPFQINGWHQSQPGGGSNDSFILQWRLTNISSLQIRGTLFGGDGSDIGKALTIDGDGNLFICGNSTINTIAATSEWCDTPNVGEFPMCDQNGLLYTETAIANTESRAFIAAFRPGGQMLWSTQYGMGDNNSAIDICTNGTKVWIVGGSNKDWTFEEFDEESTVDYYRSLPPLSPELSDATIARFDIPYILNTFDAVNKTTNPFTVYPNPNSGMFTLEFIQDIDVVHSRLAIFNSLGQRILVISLGSNQKTTIDLSGLASGVYSLRLEGLTDSHAVSIIKL